MKPSVLARCRAFSLLSVLACCLGGCSMIYSFDLDGVIRSPEGTPLPDVLVVLQGEFGEPLFSVATDAQGRFAAEFSKSAGRFYGEHTPQWTLQLSKDGFTPASMDIRLRREPVTARNRTAIFIAGVLVPLTEEDVNE